MFYAERLKSPRRSRDKFKAPFSGDKTVIAGADLNYSSIDIDHYRQRDPRSIPGAQIAWTNRFDNSDESAVLYAKQWNNPRPETAIESVDLVYGKDKDRGVPVLVAITAADVNE